MITSIRSTLATVSALVAVLAFAVPASARDAYVFDGASMFGASTVSQLNQQIGDFNAQTHKEVVVVTVPSLNGATIASEAERTFADKQVNGVLFLFAKAEKADIIVGDRASRAFFPSGSFDSIRQSMRGSFRGGDFDGGITNGVSLVLNTYRGHESSLHGGRHAAATSSEVPATAGMFGGGFSMFWLILILIAGFLIIRAIFRAMRGPRMMPPGYGGGPGVPGPGYGGPGYGGPGYGGPGYGGGFGGGGGGFFSGLLGGLGGAFIGNELFGRQNGGMMDQSGMGGIAGGDGGAGADSAGWQSDAGQADMGNASSGDWGGGGGGDFGGGGGGGDSGGGGW